MSIENWKRKLLDLTKRNRALNFRMNKVSTIAIVDEQPAEVFRQLYLQERAMRFKAAPEDEGELDQPREDSREKTVVGMPETYVTVHTETLQFVITGNATPSDQAS